MLQLNKRDIIGLPGLAGISIITALIFTGLGLFDGNIYNFIYAILALQIFTASFLGLILDQVLGALLQSGAVEFEDMLPEELRKAGADREMINEMGEKFLKGELNDG